MAGEIFIDLDRYPEPTPAERTRRPWSPVPRPNSRPLLLVLGALLISLLVLTAATAPAAPQTPLTRLPLFNRDGFFLLRDGIVYVADAQRVEAYSVQGGRQLWGVTPAGPVVGVATDEESGSVVLTLTNGDLLDLQVLDARTGATRWQRADLSGQPIPGTGRLLGERRRTFPEGGILPEGETSHTRGAELVDLRTGAALWHHPIAAEGKVLDDTTAAAPGSVVVTVDRLNVAVYDKPTGAPVVSGALADRQPVLAGPLVTFNVNLVGGCSWWSPSWPPRPPATACGPGRRSRTPSTSPHWRRCGVRHCRGSGSRQPVAAGGSASPATSGSMPSTR